MIASVDDAKSYHKSGEIILEHRPGECLKDRLFTSYTFFIHSLYPFTSLYSYLPSEGIVIVLGLARVTAETARPVLSRAAIDFPLKTTSDVKDQSGSGRICACYF